jgi:hypothetical protein
MRSGNSGITAMPAMPHGPGGSWYRKALRSRIAPLRRFARNLRPHLPHILGHCRYPFGSNH